MSDAPREKTFLLAPAEGRVLNWLAERMPARVMPDHMTVLGVLAALGIGAAYWLSGRDPAWLWVASGLLVVHWLGDSLDGTLARVRRIERPKYGYYLDHLVDAGATIAIGAGLGLSPYMGLATGLAIVIAYLALSINTYLETQVFGVFSLGYGRFGPTEARVGLIALNLALLAGVPDARRAGRARRAQPAGAGRARARGGRALTNAVVRPSTRGEATTTPRRCPQ
jgi:phosphatidylglycerophosphate synthase